MPRTPECSGEVRAAIEEARRAYPDLPLEFVQGMYGVARPDIDARRNAALRPAELERAGRIGN